MREREIERDFETLKKRGWGGAADSRCAMGGRRTNQDDGMAGTRVAYSNRQLPRAGKVAFTSLSALSDSLHRGSMIIYAPSTIHR